MSVSESCPGRLQYTGHLVLIVLLLITSRIFTLPKALLLLKLSVHPGGGVNMALASDLMRLAASSAQAQARPRGT